MKELQEVEKDLYNRENRQSRNEEYLQDRVSPYTSPTTILNYPDAKKHQIVSFIKSGIRIIGYVFIPIDLVASAIILILSEVIGIYEELV